MLLSVIFCFLLSGVYSDQNVKFAAILFRHGDRTPVKPYPTDPWRNESLWPVKFGELTNIGKRQHYALGQWLRTRYSHLISKEFDPSEIYVRSTDVDRTLMSAQANLAGMYPPVGNAIWDQNLLWQPIPIHTVPEKDDEVLAMKKPCKKYINEKQKMINSKSYQKRLNIYKNLMNYLTVHTEENINDYNEIEFIYNTLNIETLYNFTLPKWTNGYFPSKLREPSCYSFTVSTATPLLARLKVGPFLKVIVNHMSNAINSDKHHKNFKLIVFSAHDDTIGNVLNAMNIFDGNCPVYTATVLFELLYDNSTMEHNIRISYRNSTDIIEPYILTIPQCGENCPLDKFVTLYSNLLNVDWDNECQEKSILWSIFLFSALIFFVFLIVQSKYLFDNITSKSKRFKNKNICFEDVAPLVVDTQDIKKP